MDQQTHQIVAGEIAIDCLTGVPGIAVARSRSTGTELAGAADGHGFEITVLDQSTVTYRSSKDDDASLDVAAHPHRKDGIDYDVTLLFGGKTAAAVSVKIVAHKDCVTVSSELGDEAEGVEVGAVMLEVFSVGADAEGAHIATAERAGHLIDLKKSRTERVHHKTNWFDPAPVAMLWHERMLGVIWADNADSQVIHEVREEPKSGAAMAELIHRHRVESPANSFLAQKTASCTLRWVAAEPGQTVDWTDGAALIRDTIEPNLRDLYIDSMVYKIRAHCVGDESISNYRDILGLIERVHRLTDGVGQVAYIVGWQHDGLDTGYPDVYTPNFRIGSFKEFQQTKESAKRFGAILSLHDNFHDAYMNSPLWDPSIICVNPDGKLRKGGIWGAGQAYEIGPTKYLPEALVRADRTAAMLDLEVTTHLDVLSDKADMVDFDLERPATREQNAQAKIDIVDRFRGHGVDVTSEVLTSPFVRSMNHYWHLERRPMNFWKSEERIPLIPFIYHGKVTCGGNAEGDRAMLDQIEYGLTFSTGWHRHTHDAEITDMYYLITLPWSLLARREITGYRREGPWKIVEYGPDSEVRVNRADNTYKITVGGVRVAERFSTFAPRGEGVWYFYSRGGDSLALPDGDVEVVSLIEGREVAVEDGVLQAEARVPYRVTLRV